MSGQQRPGHVNYYDQLGVPSNATTEQIRDAYRALARLLHPDQQTDPHLKSVAEQQMRKLNPIYTILADPERRRHYDEDLADGGYTAPIILEGPVRQRHSKLLGRLSWVAAAMVGGGLLLWLASGNIGGGASQEAEAKSARTATVPVRAAEGPNQPSAAQPSEIAALKSEIKTLTAERDFAMRELLRIKEAGKQAPPIPAPAPAPVAAPAPVNVPPAKPTLAGSWIYSPPRNKPANSPDTADATITERNGSFTGRYHARYPNAPDINFSFSGTPNGVTLTCPWTGAGGSKGEITLRLLPDNTVRVDWAAYDNGNQQGPAAGTTILTRRAD